MKKIMSLISVSLFAFVIGCGGAATEAPTTPAVDEVAAPEAVDEEAAAGDEEAAAGDEEAAAGDEEAPAEEAM